MNYRIDPDKAASLIRGTLAVQRIKQIDIANQIGIGKALLNMFLNRKLNLLPEHIEAILDILNIRTQAEKLAGTNNGK